MSRRTEAIMTALEVESKKTASARIIAATTAVVAGGIAVMAGLFTNAVTAGNEQIIGRLGDTAELTGWPLLAGVAAQLTAAAALFGGGVVLSWMFGQEFTDGTISGLFALPIGRSTVALAKLIVYAVWGVVVSTALMLCLVIVGLALDVGPMNDAAVGALGREYVLTLLSILLALPAAWAATLGRGVLPGVVATLGVILIGQVVLATGAGAWFPVSAPALWALQQDGVSVWQLVLALVVPLAVVPATLGQWRDLQLDH